MNTVFCFTCSLTFFPLRKGLNHDKQQGSKGQRTASLAALSAGVEGSWLLVCRVFCSFQVSLLFGSVVCLCFVSKLCLFGRLVFVFVF